MSPKAVISNAMAGGLIAVINVTVAISVAALIFAGQPAAWFAAGVTVLLVATVVSGLGGTLASGFPGVIVGPRSGLAPVFAGMVAGIAAHMATGEAARVLPTILATIMATTLVAGLFLLLLGQLRLGSLVRYIPYPVMGGFFAGIGYLFVRGGLSVATGEAASLANLAAFVSPAALQLAAPAVAFAVALYVLQRRIDHWAVFPALLGLAIGGFYAALYLTGGSMAGAAETGWLPDIAAAASRIPVLAPADLALVDWAAVAAQAGSIAVVAILVAIMLLLDVSGVEILTGRDLTPDRELKAMGLTNLVNALAGGYPSVHAASDTAVTYKLGGETRLMGFVYAAAVTLAIVAGTGFIGTIPTFVLGGLLVYVGIDFLVDWVWRARKELPLADYLVVLAILAVVAVTGILQGVAFGFAVAVVLFVVSYSRLSIVKAELTGHEHASHVDRDLGVRELLNREGKRILILRLQGFIFFGTADKLLATIRERLGTDGDDGAGGEAKPDFLVLDFQHVTQLDTSAVQAFAKLAQLADKEGVDIAVTGFSDTTRARLEGIGFFRGAAATPRRVGFEQLDDGVAWCEDRILEQADHDGAADDAAALTDRLAHLLDDRAAAEAVAPYFTREGHAAGETLFRQGDAGDGLYLVHAGTAAVVIPLADGADRVVRVFRAGAVVGEMALYTGEPRSAAVRIEEDAVLFRLSADAMAALQREHPDAAGRFHAYVVRLLAERLARANRELQRNQ